MIPSPPPTPGDDPLPSPPHLVMIPSPPPTPGDDPIGLPGKEGHVDRPPELLLASRAELIVLPDQALVHKALTRGDVEVGATGATLDLPGWTLWAHIATPSHSPLPKPLSHSLVPHSPFSHLRSPSSPLGCTGLRPTACIPFSEVGRASSWPACDMCENAKSMGVWR